MHKMGQSDDIRRWVMVDWDIRRKSFQLETACHRALFKEENEFIQLHCHPYHVQYLPTSCPGLTCLPTPQEGRCIWPGQWVHISWGLYGTCGLVSREGQAGENIPPLQLLIPLPQLTPGVLPLLPLPGYKTVTLLTLARWLGLSTHKPLAKLVQCMNNCVAMRLLGFFKDRVIFYTRGICLGHH